MAKKRKNKKKSTSNKKDVTMPKERNPVVLIARMRNSAGPMKPRNQKRKNRNSWRKNIETDINE